MKTEHEIETERNDQLIRCIPDVLNYKTVLYIGINRFRSMFIKDFADAKYMIDVIEIFKSNTEYWKKKDICNYIICADIRTVKIEKNYDLIVWYHGPEHVARDEAIKTFEKLEDHANKMLILGCPHGAYPQGPEYGNENERHLSEWSGPDLMHYGFSVDIIGNHNEKGSNLLAWKRK